MTQSILAPNEKALAVNSDPLIYGSFAEIGAGQEVCRWFFRAGRASSTVAKTMSAYDMTFSDSIYGAEKNHRYVCESRLNRMLDHEFNLILERLSPVRDPNSRYFVYANTMASKRAEGLHGGHGWMGVRFIAQPGQAPSEVVIHMNLLDRAVLDQQESVGRVGVNLIHGCFFLNHDPIRLIDSLQDNLKNNRIEIDCIHFRGPAFEFTDNRLMSLHLVELGLTNAVLFTPDGDTLQPSEVLYRKHLLVQRGRFRPPTKLHLDMLSAAKKHMIKDLGIAEKDMMVFMEITMSNLTQGDHDIDVADFLARIDLLAAMGHYVLISNYAKYHRLSEFFSKYTAETVGIVMGVGHLQHLFNPAAHNDETNGALLAALGGLFRKNVKALIYPAHSLSTTMPSPEKGEPTSLITANNFTPPESVKHLYNHMIEGHAIQDLKDVNEELLKVNSESVLKHIREGRKDWQDTVPERVAKMICQRGLFGYRPSGDGAETQEISSSENSNKVPSQLSARASTKTKNPCRSSRATTKASSGKKKAA